MSLHFVSHAWDVQDVADGTRVRLTVRDLDAGTMPALAEELDDLVRHSGRPNLYLDFGAVQSLSSAILGQLVVLHRKLRDGGGHLALFTLPPPVEEVLRVSKLTDLLDVRSAPAPSAAT